MWRSAWREARSHQRLASSLSSFADREAWNEVNHPRFPTSHRPHLLYNRLLPLVDPALSRFTSDRAPQFSHTPPSSKVFLQATDRSPTLFGTQRLLQFARWPVPLFFGDPDVEPHGRLTAL